jgi:WD40 repeat protein
VGGTFASGAGDFTARIWDAASGEERRTLRNSNDVINSVAYSPEAALLAGAAGSPPPDTRDTRIFVWRVETGALIQTMLGHQGGSTSVAISPDGQTVASGGRDGLLKLWRTAGGALLKSIAGQSGGITAVAFTPDGQTVISAGGAGTVLFRRVSDGAVVRTIAAPNGIAAMGLSADGSLLVTGESAYGDNVRIWDAASGALVRVLAGHSNGFVQGVAITGDGKTVMSGSGYAREVKLWRVSDGALMETYDRETGWGIMPQLPVAFGPDGSTFGYGRTDATVVVAMKPG